MASKKYGLMTDIHFGLRKASKIILDWQLKAFYEAFSHFKNENVTDIVILGDVFDNRNTNTTEILNSFLEKFLNPLRRDFDNVYILVGNHDMFFRNTRKCNILDVLLTNKYKNVHVIQEVTRVDDILMVPWVCTEKDIADIVSESKNGGILLGHLEINGFRMVSGGKVCDEGLNQSLFSKFDLVLSGHFHLKEKIGNIEYLGTMLALNWGEYHGSHGVHTLEGTELTFHPINTSMLDCFKFENRIYEIDELEKYKDMTVKVLVDADTDTALLDHLVNQLSKISYTSTKQYMDKKKIEQVVARDKDIASIDDSVKEYLKLYLPDNLVFDAAYGLYQKIKMQAEQEMEVAR